MKKILLFLSVFVFIYSFQPKFLPIELNRVLQGLGFVVLLFNERDVIQIITNKFAQRFLGLSLGFLIFCFFAELQHSGLEKFFIKPVNIFLHLFSAYFIYWLTRKTYSNVDLGIILQYIVLVGVAQTIVSLVFFFDPQMFEFFNSFTKESDLKGFEDRFSMLGRRFVGINSDSFGGSIKFGFAFFSLLILPSLSISKLATNKILYGLCFLLIVIGGVFTARTFFITMLFGFLMILSIKATTILKFIKINLRIFLTILISIPILYIVVTFFVEPQELERSFRWAFEMFYNFFEGKGLQSSSSDSLMQNHYAKTPQSIKTWLIGDGRYMNPNGLGYYMGTDAGYLRLIYYFGLIGTLYFIIMLFGYYKVLSSVAKNKVLSLFFLTLILWNYILLIKGMVFNSEYFVLFLLFLILPNNSKFNAET